MNMLRLMRIQPCQAIAAVLSACLLVAVTAVPGLVALAPDGGGLSDRWLLDHFGGEAESVVRAIEAALAQEPASVDEFVEVLLSELGERDADAARAVLAVVLPRMSLEHFLSGGWAVEMRLLVKSDRTPSGRDLTHLVSKHWTLNRILVACTSGLAAFRLSASPNLTRLQIRELITSVPLGP